MSLSDWVSIATFLIVFQEYNTSLVVELFFKIKFILIELP